MEGTHNDAAALLTGGLTAPYVDDQANISYLSGGDCDDGLVITWTATSTVLLLTIEKSPETVNEYVRTYSFLHSVLNVFVRKQQHVVLCRSGAYCHSRTAVTKPLEAAATT